MVQAAAAALAPILGSWAGKEKPVRTRPVNESVVPAVIAAKDVKTAKLAIKEAEKERLYNLLMQPEVIGMLMTIAGLVASQRIPFSDNEASNEGLQAAMASASVLLGLGHAGVGDMTTSIIAAVAGISSLAININLPDLPDIPDWVSWFFPFAKLYDLVS